MRIRPRSSTWRNRLPATRACAHEAVDALLDARATARAEKNWAVADAVRAGITGLGFTIEDTPQGARVSYDPSEGK